MIAPDIKNIIFDLGGILLPITMTRCFENFARLGFSDIRNYVNEYYKDGLFQELELGLVTVPQFCARLRQIAHITASDAQIIDAWNTFIAPVEKTKLNALLALSRHYRVFLLSNTSQIHWDHVCRCDFAHDGFTVKDHFEKTYLSFELHITKPDAAIYEFLLKDAGIEPQASLFIDDSQKNCDAAHALGIHTYCDPNADTWKDALARDPCPVD